MSHSSIAEMIAENPLPGLDFPGDVAHVRILYETYTVETERPIKPAQVFDIFGNFPKEIQTKIWGFADIGRTITAVEIPKRLPDEVIAKIQNATAHATNAAFAALSVNNDNPGSVIEEENEFDAITDNELLAKEHDNAYRFIGAGYPTIFQVSKEVKKLAAAMGYQGMFQVHGSSKVVMFNPKVDTFHLIVRTHRQNFCTVIPLYKALVNPLELKSIRHLHVGIEHFMVNPKSAMTDIHSMVAVQTLFLYGGCQIRASLPEFTLKLKYVYDEERLRAETIADIPDNRLTGGKLGKSVRYWIPDSQEQDRLDDIYFDINNAMQAGVEFPKALPFPLFVQLSFNYSSLY